MRRFVKTKEHGVIDTEITNNRHIECFICLEGVLYAEDMDGHLHKYSEIIESYDEEK